MVWVAGFGKLTKKGGMYNNQTLVDLFPMDLCKVLVRAQLETESESAREVIKDILDAKTDSAKEIKKNIDEDEFEDEISEEGLRVLLSCLELGTTYENSISDEEVDEYVDITANLLIASFRGIWYVVKKSKLLPTMLNDSLVPVGDPHNFNKEFVKYYSTWKVCLFGNLLFDLDSDSAEQLLNAFTTNMRTYIVQNGSLEVLPNLKIVKSGSRYILEEY
jgi:hypothetical protein